MLCRPTELQLDCSTESVTKCADMKKHFEVGLYSNILIMGDNNGSCEAYVVHVYPAAVINFITGGS